MPLPQGRLWLCCAAFTLALVPAGGASPQLSGAELVARETAYHASRAMIAVYDFHKTQQTDAFSLDFRNSSGAEVSVGIYNATDTGMGIASVSRAIKSRTSWRYDAGAFGGTRNFKVFIGAVAVTPCFKYTGAKAPSIINITTASGGACSVTVLPVSQRTPADLLPYGPTALQARYRAHVQELTYLVSQTTQYLFVAFVGTEPIQANQEMNAKGLMTNSHASFPGVNVHLGWADAVRDIYPNLLKLITGWKGTRKIVVTGFSMGGALAGYLTYRLLAEGITNPIWLATFGSPRHATEDFRDAFRKRLVAPHRAYTMEMLNSRGERDEKIFEWPNNYPLLKFTVYPTGQLVEYRCAESKEPVECDNGSHVHRFYAQAAALRWSQK
jgi:hypothetical protein